MNENKEVSYVTKGCTYCLKYRPEGGQFFMSCLWTFTKPFEKPRCEPIGQSLSCFLINDTNLIFEFVKRPRISFFRLIKNCYGFLLVWKVSEIACFHLAFCSFSEDKHLYLRWPKSYFYQTFPLWYEDFC